MSFPRRTFRRFELSALKPSKWRLKAFGPLAALVCGLVCLPACGGGGGGGGGNGGGGNPGSGQTGSVFDPAKDFYLKAASFARPIFGVNGGLQQVVNPASLYEVDPITGVAVPGYPKPLTPGGSLTTLVSLNFEQILDPLTPQTPLVPRNAALVLDFSKPIDVTTLKLDNSDPTQPGLITSTSTVQVRLADGSLVPARAVVNGAQLVIHPFVNGAIGWDPSPLVFDKFGNPVQDPKGYMRVVTGVGTGNLASTAGLALKPRPDLLGTVSVPLPFNPGNNLLDAIKQQTEAGTLSFNGFLPDLTPPRIIRAVVATGTIVSVVGGSPIEITGSTQPKAVNVVANGGAGEWASSLLEVAGPLGTTTKYVVTGNSAAPGDPYKPVFRLAAGSVLDASVAAGAAFTVTRSEFFEPIPPPLPSDPVQLAKVTVDPVAHPRDPLDPEDQLNSDLRRFVRMFDESGAEVLSKWNPSTGVFLAVPPKVRLQLRFSEPMDPASFRPYESFSVTALTVPKAETGFSQQRIGRVTANADGTVLTFDPYLENQLDPSKAQFIGFGGTPQSLKLVIRTRPEIADIAALKANATPAQLAQLVDLDVDGVYGVNDLGGRGLGLPLALLDVGDGKNFLLAPTSAGLGPFPPAIDFQMAFQTAPSADPDYRAIVHRFMGQPESSVFTYPSTSGYDTVTTGVEYVDYPPVDTNEDGKIDRRYIYGPKEFDIGLNIPGRLTGATAISIEHLIDDFNKPKYSPFASPNGEDSLAPLGFGASTPINSIFGARFQHIFRAGDASPAYNEYKDVVLDLVGLAWTPVNNVITNGTLEDFSLLVGLSGVNKGNGPDTNNTGGVPAAENSGLGQQFDCNLLEWVENCCSTNNFVTSLLPLIPFEPKQAAVVKQGTPYSLLASKLYRPANAVGLPNGQFNYYLDYPTFNTGIDPYFGKTDVFSFPYDSEFPMLVEYRIRPAVTKVPPNTNFYRFSPALLSSVLPRFRVWSQGEHPLAYKVPSFGLGDPNGCNDFRAGEGGPLLAPDDPLRPVPAPVPSNGMPALHAPSAYITPPMGTSPPCVTNQPAPDLKNGSLGQNFKLPTPNSNPDTNFYFADGHFTYPLPNTTCYPGPTGQPPTTYYGYGALGTSIICPLQPNEPNYLCKPAIFGDNSRYYMLFKYRKRVSLIESPTLPVEGSKVEYLTPIVFPPLSSVDPAAGFKVEVRAGKTIDFAVPVLESGYVDMTDPDFTDKVTGFAMDRTWMKFRATFAVAKGQLQPPSVDTIIIPYRKVSP